MSVIEALPHLEGELTENINPNIRQRQITEPHRAVTSRTNGQVRLMMDSGRASAKTTGVNPATGKKEGGSGPLFRELSDPSYTVMSSPRDVMLDTAEKPVKIRSLTLPETLVLQGFNPDYDLSAARTMKSRWTMVGNAVPPPVAEAVIRGIANAEAN